MMTSKTRLRDGVELVYEIRGRLKDAPPVVLIHSLGMDHTFWNAVTPALTDETAVLVYDCRGHGRSDKPAGPYRVEGFAEDLRITRRPWQCPRPFIAASPARP
jgi:3-oxoadipate enol-lactonase